MQHDLKCEPPYFQALCEGIKPCELRREDDPPFAVGDVLVLREWWPKGTILHPRFGALAEGAFTGRAVTATVTYVLRDVPGGYAIGLSRLPSKPDGMRRDFFHCHLCGTLTAVEDVWHPICGRCGYGREGSEGLSHDAVVPTRIESARSRDPHAAGLSHDAVGQLLDGMLLEYRAAGNEAAVEVLEGVLDRITGWCRPAYGPSWGGGDADETAD